MFASLLLFMCDNMSLYVSHDLVAAGSSPSVTTVASSSLPKVVMSVDDFYYGTFKGDLSVRKTQTLAVKTSAFKCVTCSYLAENNLRLMQHMLQHSGLVGEKGVEDRNFCRFCYRQFSSLSQLQNHQEQVHGPAQSASMCRICEWAFENEPVFLSHMKSNHKPGEMPYVCQVCSYRSSFYSDVLRHFASVHADSRFLLCVFCLKVNRNPVSYQQHLLRHQVNQAFHCNRCRLQFVFLKDKMQHKLENHRSFCRPAQLEGLPPGSKVTIRTYRKVRPPVTSLLQSPPSLIQPMNIKTEPQASLIQLTSGKSKCLSSPLKRPLRRRAQLRRTSCCDEEHLRCLECGTRVLDLSAHYPTHVRCLLCPYSSCCSRAYAAHMIHHHVPPLTDQVVPLHRVPPPCIFLLQCSTCGFRPRTADHMAEHLRLKPEHYSATCRTRDCVEPDIPFCDAEVQSADQRDLLTQNSDLPSSTWKSANSWKHPGDANTKDHRIIPFVESCGPRHFLPKNSDAIDFFNLLFPETLIELISKETNDHAKMCQFLWSSFPDWVPVTNSEIRGFIGLIILMGIKNLPDLSQYWSWTHNDNSYTFYQTMSLIRFRQIAANIRMGSVTTAECRGAQSSDALSIFRPMLEILGGAMWSTYQPNCSLAVDRALLPSLEEGRLKEDAKVQPEVWLLCDSKSGYCHRLSIQVGEKVQQGQGCTVVSELVKGLEGKHHHLYLANSLASVPLLQKLLDQGIYASSSFPQFSPILPRELWEEGSLDKPGDFHQKQFGPLLVTRWRDMKEMGCLSTNAAPGEHDTVWRRSQTKVGELDPVHRPLAFRLLQENMRGVDICKQLLACNPLGGIPQDKHWRNLFWFLVNLSIVNAFIMLRESRKDSPPPWVQDGLFTQVIFRKRLGNQLAKCGQKYLDPGEMARSRTSIGPTEELVKERHRLAKISTFSKRCKNCNLKNLRHESVYGCSTCGVNLCKQPSCFWEFHGLPPLHKGSARIGFLKDRISGDVDVNETQDNVDGAMAPVEDTDLSDEEEKPADIDEDVVIKEELPKVDSRPASAPNGQSRPPAVLCKGRDDSLNTRQLRIALFALCEGLHQASRSFSTDTRLISFWLKEARKCLTQSEQEQEVNADGREHMVAWVLSMREQQLPITESSLFHKASMLKKKGTFSDSFRISYEWAVHFMLHHRLGVQSIFREATMARSLPLSLEAKVESFRTFTKRIIQVKTLAEGTVAAMDELCLFVDLRVVQDKARCSEALELTGSVPLVTVYLAVLANGIMLPSLVMTNRKLSQKCVPEFIVVEEGADSLLVEEVLELWTNKIWIPHVSSSPNPHKTMLVLDRHREHLRDSFLTSISGSGTLPAMIPGGCSFRLQPLEICLKPVLKFFLLSRWAKLTSGNPKELEESSPQQLQANVAQILVDWVIEALTHMNKLPDLWRKSFQLADLLPGREKQIDPEMDVFTNQKPEEVQSDLIKTLTETLLGPEALADISNEVLDLEGEDAVEEDLENSGDEMKIWSDGKDSKMAEREGGLEEQEEMNQDTCRNVNERGNAEMGQDKSLPEGGGEVRIKEMRTSEGCIKEQQDRIDGTKNPQKLDGKKKVSHITEDSEEEAKATDKDRKDLSNERRGTRIVIGEDVGDEWKIMVKSRTDGSDVDDRVKKH
uniref:Pogo transposable element derived with ZNF domain b n=1 Tax=Takifugu rubripes TaxID=31033 RepID=A0A3B5KFR9_TAKRU